MTISEIAAQTISGIIQNSPWFILIWIGFKGITREIREGVKKVPSWIDQYEKMRNKQRAIDWALTMRSKT